MNQTITHKYLRNLLNNLSEENINNHLMELQLSTLLIPANEYCGVSIAEFNKFKCHEDYLTVDNEFNIYWGLLESEKSPTFVVNPDSKFPITRNLLKYFKPNYIFEQDYQVFTLNEIRRIKNSIENTELNVFLKIKSNCYGFYNLMKLRKSTVLTLLMSHKNYDNEDVCIYYPRR